MTTRLTNDAPHSHVVAAAFVDVKGHDVLSARLLNEDEQVITCLDLRVPEFLDMIRSELGVIAIAKADLPEVEDGAPGRIIEISRSADPAALRDEAMRYLAAAEYIEANPPVDEATVTALVADLARAPHASLDGYARHLVQAGYTKPVQS